MMMMMMRTRGRMREVRVWVRVRIGCGCRCGCLRNCLESVRSFTLFSKLCIYTVPNDSVAKFKDSSSMAFVRCKLEIFNDVWTRLAESVGWIGSVVVFERHVLAGWCCDVPIYPFLLNLIQSASKNCKIDCPSVFGRIACDVHFLGLLYFNLHKRALDIAARCLEKRL